MNNHIKLNLFLDLRVLKPLVDLRLAKLLLLKIEASVWTNGINDLCDSNQFQLHTTCFMKRYFFDRWRLWGNLLGINSNNGRKESNLRPDSVVSSR